MTTREKPAGASGGRAWGDGGAGRTRHANTNRELRGSQVYTSDGRVAGRLVDGWLEKRLDPSRHMLRAPRGWATDRAHLELQGLRGVRIITSDTIWEASVETWLRYGVEIERGHGRDQLKLFE